MAKRTHDGDVAFVKALAELLRENDLTELEVVREFGAEDSLNVRVARQPPAPQVVQAVAAAAIPAPVAPQGLAAGAPSAPAVASEDPALHPGALTSPMVGTVYLAPEPGAPDFVAIGDKVVEGQTVLIIEAMKTMNQIAAPKGGSVKRILIEDGVPVEYGAPLMIIE